MEEQYWKNLAARCCVQTKGLITSGGAISLLPLLEESSGVSSDSRKLNVKDDIDDVVPMIYR